MASPEIDEAAAVEYAEDLQRWMHGYWGAKANLARAALAWKARAEAAEAERDFLRRGLCAAEIERDSLRRQLVQSVKAR